MTSPLPPAKDPASAVAAWRYLSYRFDPGTEEKFTVDPSMDITVVDGKVAAAASDKLESFVEALVEAAMMAMARMALVEGRATAEEQVDFIWNIIDVQIERNTLEAHARDMAAGDLEPPEARP